MSRLTITILFYSLSFSVHKNNRLIFRLNVGLYELAIAGNSLQGFLQSQSICFVLPGIANSSRLTWLRKQEILLSSFFTLLFTRIAYTGTMCSLQGILPKKRLEFRVNIRIEVLQNITPLKKYFTQYGKKFCRTGSGIAIDG